MHVLCAACMKHMFDQYQINIKQVNMKSQHQINIKQVNIPRQFRFFTGYHAYCNIEQLGQTVDHGFHEPLRVNTPTVDQQVLGRGHFSCCAKHLQGWGGWGGG